MTFTLKLLQIKKYIVVTFYVPVFHNARYVQDTVYVELYF